MSNKVTKNLDGIEIILPKMTKYFAETSEDCLKT